MHDYMYKVHKYCDTRACEFLTNTQPCHGSQQATMVQVARQYAGGSCYLVTYGHAPFPPAVPPPLSSSLLLATSPRVVCVGVCTVHVQSGDVDCRMWLYSVKRSDFFRVSHTRRAQSNLVGERRETYCIIHVHLPYSGKLSREKTFKISQFCGYSQKFSPQNLGTWRPQRGTSEQFEQFVQVSSAKILFLFSKVFSLKSFPPYGIQHCSQETFCMSRLASCSMNLSQG